MASRVISKAPRAHLFTFPLARRTLATTKRTSSANENSPFGAFGSPAPPRLPKEEQELFENLQKESTGAFSTPRSPPKINQSPDSSASENAQAQETRADRTEQAGSVATANQTAFEKEFKKVIEARGKGEELHPNVRRGATPEFEGDTNPTTGEVGGPKNEPLRWGAAGEWSYNGRTTDF